MAPRIADHSDITNKKLAKGVGSIQARKGRIPHQPGTGAGIFRSPVGPLRPGGNAIATSRELPRAPNWIGAAQVCQVRMTLQAGAPSFGSQD
jgi:hypothetical protein